MLVPQNQPQPEFSCGSRHIDVWFARMIPYLAMNHLQVHTNQDIQRR